MDSGRLIYLPRVRQLISSNAEMSEMYYDKTVCILQSTFMRKNTHRYVNL